MDKEELLAMVLHDEKEVRSDGMGLSVLRVPNGWIYTWGGLSNCSHCFVPEQPPLKAPEHLRAEVKRF